METTSEIRGLVWDGVWSDGGEEEKWETEGGLGFVAGKRLRLRIWKAIKTREDTENREEVEEICGQCQRPIIDIAQRGPLNNWTIAWASRWVLLKERFSDWKTYVKKSTKFVSINLHVKSIGDRGSHESGNLGIEELRNWINYEFKHRDRMILWFLIC